MRLLRLAQKTQNVCADGAAVESALSAGYADDNRQGLQGKASIILANWFNSNFVLIDTFKACNACQDVHNKQNYSHTICIVDYITRKSTAHLLLLSQTVPNKLYNQHLTTWKNQLHLVPFCIIFGVFTLGILYCLWSGHIDIELWNAIKLIGKGGK